MRLAGRLFCVLHDLNSLQIDPVAQGIGGLLYVNPGSAGRRRFNLPITVASLEVTPEGLRPIIHELEVGQAAPRNVQPGEALGATSAARL